MKYEYKEITASHDSTNSILDDINEAGKEGWKLINYSLTDSGQEVALMERLIK